MLFNSALFIGCFLPITLLAFFQIGGRGYFRLATAWLLAASLVFYSWWNPANLLLLLASIGFNYGVGVGLVHVAQPHLRKALLVLGITVNLTWLAYFKYANFLIATVANLTTTVLNPVEVVLPLGISFFTFQQIAYLVDSYRSPQPFAYRFLDYSLFVSFFPHLIAGPLIHHKQIIHQFANHTIYRFNSASFAMGVTLFGMGLFKKVILADGVAPYSTQIFAAATDGVALTVVEAWIGALAFTLQLYFDFSGYSDMAIGLAKMIGIDLPINFNSPYKAVNIVDFWRRWHITLSNFLRDYLYIPLGGNRKGKLRRNLNLMITMLLGGLWHGAAWTFVVWGGLHGVYLLINHQWRSLWQRLGGQNSQQNPVWAKRASWLLTFVAVVVGWVFFKAKSLEVAVSMLRGMVGLNGISLPASLEDSLGFMQAWGVQFNDLMPSVQLQVEQLDDVNEIDPIVPILKISALLLLVWLAPNTQEWLTRGAVAAVPDQGIQPSDAEQLHRDDLRIGPVNWQTLGRLNLRSFNLNSLNPNQLSARLSWRPNRVWAVISAILTAAALLNLAQVSEFLYFEF